MRLTLVGTGHVFRIGEIVAEIIRRRGPHVVCVELDPVRLAGLQERERMTAYEEAGDPRAEEMRRRHDEAAKRLPLIYKFLAKLQDKLASQEGVEAGSEMLAAVQAAQKMSVPLVTIDVDAQDLIRRAWREMSWKERIRFLWAIMRGKGGGEVEAELAEYQEDPVAYLARVGDEFPSLKRVLIDERDEHMANRILALRERGYDVVGRWQERQPPTTGAGVGGAQVVQKITETAEEEGKRNEEAKGVEEEGAEVTTEPEFVVVAVVGDGHIPGMMRILQERMPDSIETIRVGDLREGNVPEARKVVQEPAQTEGSSVSLRFDVEASDPPENTPPGY